MHCEKMTVTDMTFRQHAVTEFLVKDGNSARVICGVYGDACMGSSNVRRWVKHFKDGSTDIADQPRCGRPITAATESNKQKVDEFIRQDRRITGRETAAQLGMRHHAVQKMMEILGYRKSCSRWVPRLLMDTEKTKRLETALPPTLQSGLTPSDYHLFGPLKDDLRGHHYETDEAVQEAVRSWMRGSGTDFYRRGIFKILQRW
jgi:transposase